MVLRRALLPDMGLLQTFECAARHGNFSRAAEELSLTQSAVSRQIRELEEQVGLNLFERIRKRVVLSDAGSNLLPQVRDLLAGAERMMLGALSGDVRARRLRVATLPTFGSRWLVPRLGQFLARHPDVALTLESRDRAFSFQDEPVDLVIHYGQPVWPGGVTTFLCSELVVPVASRAVAAQLAAGGAPDLSAAHLLHLTGRPGLWAEWLGAVRPCRRGPLARHAVRSVLHDHRGGAGGAGGGPAAVLSDRAGHRQRRAGAVVRSADAD